MNIINTKSSIGNKAKSINKFLSKNIDDSQQQNIMNAVVAIQQIWSRDTVVKQYTSHRLDHNLRVLYYCSELINSCRMKLDSTGCYILTMAALLHDFGMQCTDYEIIAKFMKSSTVWILGIIMTLFVGVASLEGNLSSSVDGVTAKTTKAAVSNFIPVVGKILGDAVDTVMGCSIILKNAVGVVGVIVIIGICIVPILKLAILMIMYYLGSALCQPIADAKIIQLLAHMGDTFKMLLAILCSVSVMLIIGVTLIIQISNSGAMYG